VFFSLFHSISAFCNAGYSTLGPGLADPRVVGSIPLQGAIMALIIVDGLGFPVVKGFWVHLSGRLRYRLRLTDRILLSRIIERDLDAHVPLGHVRLTDAFKEGDSLVLFGQEKGLRACLDEAAE
jgi:hypothetical protein